jgi:hypothetical protein
MAGCTRTTATPDAHPSRRSALAPIRRRAQASSSFGTEDRLKHLGRQRDSSKALDGPAVTSWGPQIGLSPGPIYLPTYSVTELQARSSSFPGESRAKSSAVASVSRAKTPGPGAYTPAVQHAVLSTKPRVVRQTHFPCDSRLKYLGEQLEGVTILRITSPGPAYAPNHDFVLKSYGGVSFGKPQAKMQRCVLARALDAFASGARGQRLTAVRTRRLADHVFCSSVVRATHRAMSFADQSPGPGTYSPAVQAAVLSTKITQHAPSFGKEQRFSAPGPGDVLRRPVTPGPKYLPNYAAVRALSKGVKIGTAKRFGGCCEGR